VGHRSSTARARQLVTSSETILGVWVVSDANRSSAVKQALAPLALPCWWPEAILCAPCLCAFCHSANEALKTTVYVLTDKRLYQSIDTPQKAVCCSDHVTMLGRDSGDVALGDINSVGADLPGSACEPQVCCPASMVIIGLPLGHPLATLGGGVSMSHGSSNSNFQHHIPNTKMALFVDHPEQVMRMIREAKDKVGQQQQVVTVVPGVAVAPMAPCMEMAREVDPAEGIMRLKKLLEAGAITESEFEAKKTELLHRL